MFTTEELDYIKKRLFHYKRPIRISASSEGIKSSLHFSPGNFTLWRFELHLKYLPDETPFFLIYVVTDGSEIPDKSQYLDIESAMNSLVQKFDCIPELTRTIVEYDTYEEAWPTIKDKIAVDTEHCYLIIQRPNGKYIVMRSL